MSYIHGITVHTKSQDKMILFIYKECEKMKTEYTQYYTKIGLKIAYYRKLKGYTQEQLAEK